MARARVQPVPVLAGVLVFVIGLQLGNWQMRRADEKAALSAAIAAAEQAPAVDGRALIDAPEWQVLALKGEWVGAGTVLLDNRIQQGVAGYDVHTPLKLADDLGFVLVKRGWVMAGQDRSKLPQLAVPDGEVSIEGIVRKLHGDGFTLASAPGDGPVLQYLDLEHYRNRTGIAVRDWVLQQNGGREDGLVRQWPRPDAGVDRHHGYAFQWYSLAGLSLVLTLVYLSRSFFKHAT